MTPLFFLKHMDMYIGIEFVWFFLVLFFLDISGMIVIPTYFMAMYLGNLVAENKYKKTVKEIERLDQEDRKTAIKEDLTMESKWSTLQASLANKSMEDIKNMDYLDPHQKAMLLSMKAWIRKAALDAELKRIKGSTEQ